MLGIFATSIVSLPTGTAMKTAIMALAMLGLSAASITCIAGVAPTHDASQLSQSGAKIAPPQKNAEPPKKDEKEKEQDKDQKR
jgi:hypothetical protein